RSVLQEAISRRPRVGRSSPTVASSVSTSSSLSSRSFVLVSASSVRRWCARTRLPSRDGAFDLVFVVEVMGEIPDKPRALSEFRRVLRPEGTLAVSEAALLDPDYVRLPVLMRFARAAGFTPCEGFSQWLQYTQRCVSPPPKNGA